MALPVHDRDATALHPEGSSALSAVRQPTRRTVLRRSAGVAAVGTAAAVAGYAVWGQGNSAKPPVFASLAEALGAVERLSAQPVQALEPATSWTWAQTLEHCAQSIEYSLTGFPAPRSALFQNTLGAAAFQVFAARGHMAHSLTEPIPGAPALTASAGEVGAALARLRSAVARFEGHTGPLRPHFAYGRLSKAQYVQAHAMHLANHLTAFERPR